MAFGRRVTTMSNTPVIRDATRSDLLYLHELIERGYRGDSARLGWTHQADLVDGERIDIENFRRPSMTPLKGFFSQRRKAR